MHMLWKKNRDTEVNWRIYILYAWLHSENIHWYFLTFSKINFHFKISVLCKLFLNHFRFQVPPSQFKAASMHLSYLWIDLRYSACFIHLLVVTALEDSLPLRLTEKLCRTCRAPCFLIDLGHGIHNLRISLLTLITLCFLAPNYLSELISYILSLPYSLPASLISLLVLSHQAHTWLRATGPSVISACSAPPFPWNAAWPVLHCPWVCIQIS